MRGRRLLACLFGAALVAALGVVPAPGAAAEVPGTPGELIVAFDPAATASGVVDDVHDEVGGDTVEHFEELSLDVVEVDDVDAAIEEYASQPGVRYVEVNGTVSIAANDPHYDRQWHLNPRGGSNRGSANVEAAWSVADGTGVTVAVVDTGVRVGGSDLDSARVLAGKDFVNNDDDATDDHGHGTHIAGSIAQSTDNSTGVAGVAPQAKIRPVKVLNAAGAGTYSDVIDGILWAKSRSDVINLSLSGSTYSQALCDAVSSAASEAVVVAAAGNAGIGSISYPAACDSAIAVGAVRYDGQRAGYSNTGSALDLVGPGGDLGVDQNGDGYGDGVLQQTHDGGWSYTFYEGTSMAAAHVSGVAALVLDLDAGADVRDILVSTAVDLGSGGHDSSYGHGLVDAKAAVDEAQTTGTKSKSAAGYWIAARDGRVQAFGGATAHGSVSSNGAAIVAIESYRGGDGYWLLDEHGGVHAFGDAPYRGSLADLRAQGKTPGTAAALDIASMPDGSGYWILDAAGGIFTFGDARFHGSIPGLRQAGQSIGPADVVDIASTATGEGYWILDSVGGMFAFGDARFRGSIPGLRNAGIAIGQANIVGMAPTKGGAGYWLVDDAGGMFAFGDAKFHGSIPGLRASGVNIGPSTVTAMEPTSSGHGYWLVDHVGGMFTFGDAPYHGSLPSAGVAADAAGIAPSA